MDRNPYRIEGPALISFSGGRTSGYMLRQILDAHGGALPDDVRVVFANTGRERPETLDFVAECGRRWGVPIVWIEWRNNEAGYELVGHNSASRSGEPFASLTDKRRLLPNPVTRFCTQELKVRPMKKFMLASGFDHWLNVVGIRADEPRRVARMRTSAAKERWENFLPLAVAGVSELDVLAFWRSQPFDLGITSAEGNCDLCFLKGAKTLMGILRERPDLALWWIGREDSRDATFRNDRNRKHLRLKVPICPEFSTTSPMAATGNPASWLRPIFAPQVPSAKPTMETPSACMPRSPMKRFASEI